MKVNAGMVRCWAVSVSIAGLSLLTACTASANTYTASNTAEFETAIASANANPGANTIELATGVYSPRKKVTFTNKGGTLTIVGATSAPGVTLNGGSVQPFPSELLEIGEGVSVALRNVTVTTGGGSGVVAISDLGNLEIEDSTIAGNNGAGIHVEVGATATVRNSTLSDGLEFGLIDSGTASFFNSTVAFNNGGIDNASGTLSLTNTIVAENGLSGNCTGPATSSDHSLDSDGTCGVGALSSQNPKLNSSLLKNGGPTSTHVLQVGSPAIDAGDSAACPATDQRGLARPDVASTQCDVGATEYYSTPPAITVPANITTEATSSSGAVVTYSASATSSIAKVTSFGCTPASESTFPVGTTTVNCTATDSQGNTAGESFTVTVTAQKTSDATAPELHIPSNMTVSAESASGAKASYTVTATDPDNNAGELIVECSPASGSTFPLGETTVECSAKDPAGNTSHASFKITVKDTTPPKIEKVPANITLEASNSSGAVVTYTNPTATDNVDGTDAVACKPASGSTFPVGGTAVTCTSTDKAGNTSTATFSVTVSAQKPVDTTPPAIEKVPANITVEASSSAGAVVTYTNPTATDDIDGTDPVSCSPASGSIFSIGETRVVCGSTDKAGNASTATFTVTVVQRPSTAAPETKGAAPETKSSAPENKAGAPENKAGKRHHGHRHRRRRHHRHMRKHSHQPRRH
jgi:hypothetical protein